MTQVESASAANGGAEPILHTIDPQLGGGLCGNVDSIDASGIVGWLIDVSDPGRSFHVDAQLGSALVSSSETYLERPDVGTLLGRSVHCGFALPWDRERLARALRDAQDAAVLALRIVTRGDGRSIGAEAHLQANDLREWLDALPARPAHFTGRLDSLSPYRISGYIIDRTSPSAKVELDVLLDGKVVGQILADHARPDLASSGISLACGFEWTIPRTLHDGRTGRLEVMVRDRDFLLPGSGVSLQFPLSLDEPIRELRFCPGAQRTTGWVVDSETDDPLSVELLVDGQLAATGLAGKYGPQLANDPHYPSRNVHTCFSFPTPRQALDGWPHQFSLRVVAWGTQQPPEASVTWACGGHFGNLEECAAGKVSGWVAFRGEPAQELRSRPVEIRAGEQLIGQCFLGESAAPASSETEGAVAYRFQGSLGSALAAEVSARYAGVDLRGASASTEPQQKLNGRLDRISRELLVGWAVDMNHPHDRVDLELVVDGQVIACFHPTQARPDVLSFLGLASAKVGFSLSTPELLLDGEPHQVEVRFAVNKTALAAKFREVQFKHSFRGLPVTDPHPVLSEFIGPARHPIAASSGKPVVSIVVLNRNGENILDALFSSFLAVNTFPRYEFIVVDHASRDGSVAILEKWVARGVPLKILALPFNGSFSASNNLAVRKHARGEYVLLLNNDIVFVQDVLAELIRTLKEDPAAGLVGMKLLDVVEDRGVNFYPTIQHLGIRFGDFGRRGILPYDEQLSPQSAHEAYRASRPAGVTGAAMLCRRAEYLACGGLDEAYFYGYEDVDFCLRYRVVNRQQVVCRNDLQALHHRGYSRLSGREMGIFDRLDRNHVALMRRWGYAIRSLYRRSLLQGDRVYSSERLRIAFAVSDTALEEEDYLAARALAEALAGFDHVEPVFVAERDNWHDLDRIHVLIVMRPDYDLRMISAARADLLKVAWLRGDLESWVQQRWFGDFDLYLSSAREGGARLAELGYRGEEFPLTAEPGTPTARAASLLGRLARHATEAVRIAIKVPLATVGERRLSADWHFASGLKRALKAHGHSVRIDPTSEWHTPSTADDVVIVLRGASAYTPDSTHINLLWILSAPEDISIAECGLYDHVFCASPAYTEHLRALGVAASTLLRCADPELMKPAPSDPAVRREHLFIGNSHGQPRRIVADLLGLGVDVAICGHDWAGLAPDHLVEDEPIEHQALCGYYSNAGVVYNDHAPEMAKWGFLSRRLFDAAACGACLVSDHVEGIAEVFAGLVPTYQSVEDLARLTKARHGWQSAQGQALRELVLARHTFAHRAAAMLERIRELAATKLQGTLS